MSIETIALLLHLMSSGTGKMFSYPNENLQSIIQCKWTQLEKLTDKNDDINFQFYVKSKTKLYFYELHIFKVPKIFDD